MNMTEGLQGSVGDSKPQASMKQTEGLHTPQEELPFREILEMRRRSVWEAADSGILLWRANFLYFIPFFALPVWLAASALMFIPEDFRWISWLTLWWLKPFFDRLCLHVTALRFFTRSSGTADDQDGSASSFKAMFKGMGKMIFQSLPGDLLWRRFSPIRGTAMPIRLLERPGKKIAARRTGSRMAYEERKKILASGGLHFGALLSCIGPLIETFLLGGEFIFVRIFFEFFFPGASWSLGFSTVDTTLFVFAAYSFNYILVESLYVCMSFGIYINCRTEVEGWDIQLLFQKFTGKAPLAKAPTVKALILCLGLVFFTPCLNADEPPLQTDSTEEDDSLDIMVNLPPDFLPTESIPYEELKEILSSDDFGGVRPGWSIRLKNQKEPVPPPQINYPDWLKKLREILAIGLRTLVILIIAGFLVFFFVKFLEFRRSSRQPRKKTTNEYANTLLTSEDPETCFLRAEEFFRSGLLREAWAACLCGVVNSYVRFWEIFFPPDSTEYGCLEIVRSRFAGSRTQINGENISFNPAAGFEELVKNWVFLAYGGRNPPDGSFEKALMFGRRLEAISTSPVSVSPDTINKACPSPISSQTKNQNGAPHAAREPVSVSPDTINKACPSPISSQTKNENGAPHA